jgi:hypothetical protein
MKPYKITHTFTGHLIVKNHCWFSRCPAILVLERCHFRLTQLKIENIIKYISKTTSVQQKRERSQLAKRCPCQMYECIILQTITKQSYVVSKFPYVCLSSFSNLFPSIVLCWIIFPEDGRFLAQGFPHLADVWLSCSEEKVGYYFSHLEMVSCQQSLSVLSQRSGVILKNPSVTSRSCNILFADNL